MTIQPQLNVTNIPKTNQNITESGNEPIQMLLLDEWLINLEAKLKKLAGQNLTTKQQVNNQIWLEKESVKFGGLLFPTNIEWIS